MIACVRMVVGIDCCGLFARKEKGVYAEMSKPIRLDMFDSYLSRSTMYVEILFFNGLLSQSWESDAQGLTNPP